MSKQQLKLLKPQVAATYKSALELVGKEKALEYLRKNKANRNLSRVGSHRYAEVMRRGEWVNNSESIKFDSEGFLRDGQHRLQAIVEADVYVELNVVRGVPPEYFDTIDTGMKRTPAHALQMIGVENAGQVAAALRLYYHYVNATPNEFSNPIKRPTSRAIIDLLKHHQGIRASVTRCNRKEFYRFAPASLLGCAHYIFSRIDETAAESFIAALRDGAGLSSDDPVYRLREFFINMIARKGYRKSTDLLAVVIKAWNLHRAGKKVKALSFKPEGGGMFGPEEYPKAC